MIGPDSSPAHDLVLVSTGLPPATRAGTPQEWRDPAGIQAALWSVAAARRATWAGRPESATAWTGSGEGEEVWLHPVAVPPAEAQGYFRGPLAPALDALYEAGQMPGQLSRQYCGSWLALNRRYARSVAEIAAPGAVLWIHDHHLQPLPACLRRLRPDLLIGFSLHSTFPPAELFARLPMRREILAGMLGADLIGLPREYDVATLLGLVGDVLHHPVGDHMLVTAGGRRVQVGAFPLSVDVAGTRRVAADPAVRARSRALRSRLPDRSTVILSVSRLCPHDGTEQLLRAYAELLETGALDPARTALVLAAHPDPGGESPHSRRGAVEQQVARINGRHSRIGHLPVHYLHQPLSRSDLVALYLAADVLVSTPLYTEASQVVREFAAARTDGAGRVVVSEFTDTDAGLPGTLAVNPCDPDALRAAIRTAATVAPPGDTRPAPQQLHIADVHEQAGRFLSALGECIAQTYQRPARPRPPRPLLDPVDNRLPPHTGARRPGAGRLGAGIRPPRPVRIDHR